LEGRGARVPIQIRCACGRTTKNVGRTCVRRPATPADPPLAARGLDPGQLHAVPPMMGGLACRRPHFDFAAQRVVRPMAQRFPRSPQRLHKHDGKSYGRAEAHPYQPLVGSCFTATPFRSAAPVDERWGTWEAPTRNGLPEPRSGLTCVGGKVGDSQRSSLQGGGGATPAARDFLKPPGNMPCAAPVGNPVPEAQHHQSLIHSS